MLGAKLLETVTRFSEHLSWGSKHQSHVVVNAKGLPGDEEERLLLDQCRAKVEIRFKGRELFDVKAQQEVHCSSGEGAVEPRNLDETVVCCPGVMFEPAGDLLVKAVGRFVQNPGQGLLNQGTRSENPVAPAVKAVSDGVGVVSRVMKKDPSEPPSRE